MFGVIRDVCRYYEFSCERHVKVQADLTSCDGTAMRQYQYSIHRVYAGEVEEADQTVDYCKSG